MEEAKKHVKTVKGVAVPPPPESAQEQGPARAYVLYSSVEDAEKSYKIFHNRTLNENTIRARYVSEEEYQKAAEGEWTVRHKGVAGIPLPGLFSSVPFSSGVYGLTALNPALASLIQTNPGLVDALRMSIEDEDVLFEEGWVKLRGFPASVTKSDIRELFKGCGTLKDEDIKVVHSADGTPLGEAYIHFTGPDAKVRLALTRDKTIIPNSKVVAEVLTAYEEDTQRRMFSGCQLF